MLFRINTDCLEESREFSEDDDWIEFPSEMSHLLGTIVDLTENYDNGDWWDLETENGDILIHNDWVTSMEDHPLKDFIEE